MYTQIGKELRTSPLPPSGFGIYPPNPYID